MEIIKIIHSNQLISVITNFLLNLIFGIIRKSCKLLGNPVDCIVIIAIHKLGDTVYTIPAIKEIYKFYKKPTYVFCYADSIPIYRLGIDSLNYIPLRQLDFSFGNRIANHSTRKKLHRINPKTIIDLTGVMTSASLIFNSKASNILGMSRKQFRAIYDQHTNIEYKNHITDMYLNVVSLFNQSVDYKVSSIFESKTTSIKKILIHPFAGWAAKEWGLIKFINLAETLNNKFVVSFIVPRNKLSVDIINELKLKHLELVETDSVDELIDSIRSCSLFIGNDSGPIHIASLLGKTTFTIYGPTLPSIHIPLGKLHNYINLKLKCTPLGTEKMCFTDGGRDGCPSFDCMHNLTVEEVKEKLFSFIDKFNN